MDVVLHLGAHRTGTAGFQNYMRRHVAPLAAHGVGFYGPRRGPEGLHAAVLSSETDIRGRASALVRAKLDAACKRGIQKLVVSDQNMIGRISGNVDQALLYPDAGDRLRRFAAVFDGRVTTVLLSPRSLDHYWTSALAYAVFSGQPVPSRETRHQIAVSTRGWRDVIADIAAVLPDADIRVLPFETYAGRPDALLSAGLGIAAPIEKTRLWLNRAPVLPDLRRVLTDRRMAVDGLPFGMGRWNPFTNEEHAALREMQADDMMWLTAGADGLATLTEDRCENRAGTTLPLATDIKGRSDEHQERQMARPG